MPSIRSKQMHPARTRSQRLVVLTTCTLLICMWSAVALWSFREYSGIVVSNALILEQLSSAVQEQTRGLVKQAELMVAVAGDWMTKHPAEDPGTSADFIGLVDKLRKSTDGVIDLRLVTHTGELRYIPDAGQTHHVNVSDRDYFQAQLTEKTRGLFIGQPVISRVTHKWGVSITSPTTRAGGNVGVISAVIEHDRINAAFDAQRIKPSGTIAIFRSDGTTIFRSPFDERFLGKTIAQSADWSTIQSESPHGVYRSDATPLDGVSRMVSYSRMHDYPLVVVVTTGVEQLLGPWKLHTAFLAAGAATISMFTVLICSVLLRSMAAEDRVKQELEQLMLTDSLTGVGNRRFLNVCLAEEINRANRYGSALTAVFLDLDHFKLVNDRHGHAVGDAVLVAVAQNLASNLRRCDYLGRFGGEEFVALLPETTIEDAVNMVERMREAVGNLSIPGYPGHLTMSAGLAQRKPNESAEDLLQRSDSALYRAKAEGRNQACVDSST